MIDVEILVGEDKHYILRKLKKFGIKPDEIYEKTGYSIK